MSPVVVTYLGFVVVILILLWGVFEVYRRYGGRGRRKTKTTSLTPLVPFKPTPMDTMSAPHYDAPKSSEDTLPELHARSQQNGHFSESKKNI